MDALNTICTILPKVFVVWGIMVTAYFNKKHVPSALRIKPR